MNRRTLTRVVALVALVAILAGCSGFGDAGADEREPFTVEDPLDRSIEEELANSTVWLEHVAAVDGEAHVRTHSVEFRDADREQVERIERQTTYAGGDESLTEATWTRATPEGAVTKERIVWLDADGAVSKVVDENETTTISRDAATWGPQGTILEVHVLELLDDVQDRLQSVEDDEEWTLLVGQTDVGAYESARFVIRVSDAGHIETIDIEGVVERDGRNVIKIERIEFESVGEPIELEAPEWVEGR